MRKLAGVLSVFLGLFSFLASFPLERMKIDSGLQLGAFMASVFAGIMSIIYVVRTWGLKNGEGMKFNFPEKLAAVLLCMLGAVFLWIGCWLAYSSFRYRMHGFEGIALIVAFLFLLLGSSGPVYVRLTWIKNKRTGAVRLK